MSRSGQRGFTMIELVVVIVILGILAAFALPKYMGLEKQARESAVNGMAGSLRSAANMAHGMWLAQGNPASITVNGAAVALTNGYPTAASVVTLIQDTTSFTVAVAAPNTTFTPNGATTPASCDVVYKEAANANTPFTVTTPTAATMNTSC